MPLARIAVAGSLLCLVAAAGPISPRKLAHDYLQAFRAHEEDKQAMLAAKVTRSVDYTLVVYALLEEGHADAAKALVDARQGPERKGLEALLRTLTAGLMPTRDEERAWMNAERLIQQRRPVEALEALEGAGAAVAGTVMGVRIHWTRARAYYFDRRTREATEAFGRCAQFARGIGWFSRQREAEVARLRLAPKGSELALSAAEGLVEALEALDDRPALLTALAQRGSLRIAHAKDQGGREDFVRAIELARTLKQPYAEAQLAGKLALFFQVHERAPRRALGFHRQALRVLRRLVQEGNQTARHAYQQSLHNTALVLTDLARYGDAIDLLDELFRQEPLPGALRLLALRQRGYVLRRQGRVNRSLAAYQQVLAATPEGRERERIRIELGRLQFLRGDLRASERAFDQVLRRLPDDVDALSGRGSVRAVRKDVVRAKVDFDAALELARGPVAKSKVLLARVSARRAWGDIRGALVDAREALKLLLEGFASADHSHRDYGNTAVAYIMIGDLILLDGLYEQALETIEKGAVFFYRLQDVARAIPAYARWTLTLIALGRSEEALRRFQVLDRMAKGTSDPSLKSTAKCVEAILELRSARYDNARRLLLEARDLARKADNREREANALAHLALLNTKDPVAYARRALALIDDLRLPQAEAVPFVEGESPAFAASIALQRTSDPAEALPLMERVRAERIQVALGGRATILEATLDDPLYALHVAARTRLMEARAEAEGVKAAEVSFDAMVATLRTQAPAAAALAFPAAPSLADVQAALRADEAMLLMLHDPYVRKILAVRRQGAVFASFDPKDPLEPVKAILEQAKILIVVPDGVLSIDVAPWKKAKVMDAFAVYYVPSAAAFLRLRSLPPDRGQGAGRLGPGPQRLPVRFEGRLRVLHIGTAQPIDLGHPEATAIDLKTPRPAETVVLANPTYRRGKLPRVDGVAALAEALFFGGSRRVVLSLVGAVPEEFWRHFYELCLDRGMSAPLALRQARLWIRERDARSWAGVVVWGAP